MAEDTNWNLTSLTADVVSAYVSNNRIGSDDLATLIGSTYEALKSAGEPAPSEPETAKPDKATVKKSVHPDHLVSFVDGRKYKSLKRHLSIHGMTPGEYRVRYGLPTDYPMVAASYSAQRSALAKSLGLGRKASSAASAPAASAPAAETPKAKGRGRPKAIKPQDESFS